jgi:hypothetical protein
MASTEALLHTVDKQDKQIKSLRQRASEASEVMVGTVFTVAGGPLVAWLDTERPNQEWFGFTEPTLIGAVATIAGMMKWAGQYSHLAQSFGSGVLTVEAYKAMRQRLQRPAGTSGDVGAMGPMRAARPVGLGDMERLWSNMRGL